MRSASRAASPMFTFRISAPIVQVSGSTLIAERRAAPETRAGAPGFDTASVTAVMRLSSCRAGALGVPSLAAGFLQRGISEEGRTSPHL